MKRLMINSKVCPIAGRREKRTRFPYLILAILVSGCDSIVGCNEKPRTYEYDFSGSAEFVAAKRDLIMSYVAESERQGFDCSSAPLRNAAGASIGTRYTCTKC